MKPLIFLLCALWRVSGVVLAQEDQPDCVFCYQARDYTCDGSTNCQTLTFTSPCEIDVYLSCAIGCANGVDVNHCRVTATLKHAGGVLPLVECVNWDQDRCWTNSGTPAGAHLQMGEEYVVTACLESCGPEDCCGNCRAVASVYTKGAACPAP
jgi:hypothetical protein